MTAVGLSNLVVEVLHNRGDDNRPDWSVGSGFFVGTRLVLTALHNVDGPGELLVRVHGTEERPAVVRLQGDKDIVDLAVLEVSGVVVDIPPLRYGAVDRSAPAVVERCWAVGFPRFKERVHDPKPLRLSAQVNGEIPTGENLDQPLLTLQVRSSPRLLPSSAVRESEWAGMSGATVFSGNNIIMGVITEHHLPEGESALTVVPITALDLLPEAEATKWWKLLGVDHQALVHLPGEAPSSLSRVEQQNRTQLMKRVQATWIEGLLEHSLHEAARLELHLQERPDVLVNPWRLQVQELDRPPQDRPPGTSIVQVYDEADGELLILGEPGAGKTTLLLELARTLLERAENDEQLRMPIVFNLSSWAEKRQPLSIWLVEELWTKYQVPRKIGQGWIDADQVLPLLDGLDEVAKETRAACVEQINNYYQSRLEHGSSPIAVCCRSEDYTALSTRVMLQHAVSILSLTDGQINTYLEQAGEKVEALRQALDEDVELHSLARQPLMLNIFTLAYQGATPAEVPTGKTREETRHTIFATYVERMLKRREQSKRWKPEQIIHWLTFLAMQMRQQDQTVFSIESLQPAWLSRRWKILYQWSVVLLLGLVFALTIGLWIRQISGLVFGLVVGLLLGLIFGRDTEIDPVEALTFTWSWKNVRSGLEGGVGFGLIYGLSYLKLDPWLWLVTGLVSGLVVGVPHGIDSAKAPIWSWKNVRSGLEFGLVFGLVFGLFGLLGGLGRGIGLIGGLVTVLGYVLLTGPLLGLSGRQLLERLSLSPNEGIWRSGKNGLVVWLFFVLIGGLIGGLGYGLIGGLCFGLTSGLHAFMKHFILRFFLSRRGDLPWGLVPFLDEAAERLLLRKVSGSYIFVHRLLLDYFAILDKPVSTEGLAPEGFRLIQAYTDSSNREVRVYRHDNLKEYQRAIEDYTRAVELDPKDAVAYSNRGLAYLWLGNTQQAKDAYRRSWELDRTDINSPWMAEWVEMGRERVGIETAARLEEIAAANPEDYVAYVCRGVALSLRSKLKKGLAEVERAILLNPEGWDAYFWKGMLCAYLGRSLTAMEAFEKALEVDLPPLLLTPLYWLEKDRPNFFSKYAAPLLARYNV